MATLVSTKWTVYKGRIANIPGVFWYRNGVFRCEPVRVAKQEQQTNSPIRHDNGAPAITLIDQKGRNLRNKYNIFRFINMTTSSPGNMPDRIESNGDNDESVSDQSVSNVQPISFDACIADPTSPWADQDFNDLIDQYHRVVYQYAYRLSGNQADAEDLSQQVFLQAYQKIGQLKDPGKIKSWLLSIVRNSYFKLGRRRRPVAASTVEINVDKIPANDNALDAIDSESLQIGLDQLDESQRVIVTLYYFEQLSYKEIATALDIKIGTVMSRLSRAKSRLRGFLFDENGQNESTQ